MTRTIMEAKEGKRDSNEVYDNVDALMDGLMGHEGSHSELSGK